MVLREEIHCCRKNCGFKCVCTRGLQTVSLEQEASKLLLLSLEFLLLTVHIVQALFMDLSVSSSPPFCCFIQVYAVPAPHCFFLANRSSPTNMLLQPPFWNLCPSSPSCWCWRGMMYETRVRLIHANCAHLSRTDCHQYKTHPCLNISRGWEMSGGTG